MADKLYDTIYMKDYDKNIRELSEMLLPEKWGFKGEDDFSILKNYLSHTLNKLEEENKIYQQDNTFCFNTGLYTKYYECVYLLAKKSSRKRTDGKEWIFEKFCTEYDLDIVTPERANYFSDPSLLIFDWNCDLRIKYGHILEDHPERYSDEFINSKSKHHTLDGAIKNSLDRVIANYKLAVPQYYKGTIQLLIPIYLNDNDTKPSVALTLEKRNNIYYGSTCLTLDYAYNNARLIARPESNWLTVE